MRWLIGCHLAAAVLLLSWIWGPTGAVWQQVDEAVFHALNGSLNWSEKWMWLWAMWNTRRWDTLSGVIMLTVLMIYMFGYRPRLRQRMAECAFLGIYLLALVAVTREFIFEIWPVGRLSPTIALDPVVSVNEHLPEVDAKETSSDSFPGDHAIVSFTFAALLWRYAGRRFGMVAAALSIWFVLPRMVVGAHWLSDIVVGGGAIALIVTSWALATPLERTARWHLLRGIDGLGRQIPLLQRA